MTSSAYRLQPSTSGQFDVIYSVGGSRDGGNVKASQHVADEINSRIKAAPELYAALDALNVAIVDAVAAGTIPPVTGPLLDCAFAARAALAKVSA